MNRTNKQQEETASRIDFAKFDNLHDVPQSVVAAAATAFFVSRGFDANALRVNQLIAVAVVVVVVVVVTAIVGALRFLLRKNRVQTAGLRWLTAAFF
jgi:hypothetical protein